MDAVESVLPWSEATPQELRLGISRGSDGKCRTTFFFPLLVPGSRAGYSFQHPTMVRPNLDYSKVFKQTKLPISSPAATQLSRDRNSLSFPRLVVVP